MRKSFIWAVLVLVIAGFVMAGSVVASGPPVAFSASGPVLTIDPGTVFPAGKSGRFVVMERTVTGALTEGDIQGDLTFVYKANVDIQSQSGQLHGTLSVGDYEAKVRGRSSFLLGPGIAVLPDGSFAVVVILGIDGSLTFTEGAQGHGTIGATVTAAIDPYTGHILGVVPSGLPVLDPATYSLIGFTSSEVNIGGSWLQ